VSAALFRYKNYFLELEIYVFVTLVAQKAEALITPIVPWLSHWIVSWKKATIIASGKERVPLQKYREGNLTLV
jgi:hypothetical protein